MTLDAVFDSRDAVEEVRQHFGHRFDATAVIALPHHGSVRNFHESLVSLGAGRPPSPLHPFDEVIRITPLRRLRRLLLKRASNVTSCPRTRRPRCARSGNSLSVRAERIARALVAWNVC
jgi:hypothetical protein